MESLAVVDRVRVHALKLRRFLWEDCCGGQMRVHWGQASSVGQIARYKLDHALLGPIFELATRTGNQYAIPLGNQSYFSILHAGENCLLLRTLRTFLLVTHLSLLLVIVATSF